MELGAPMRMHRCRVCAPLIAIAALAAASRAFAAADAEAVSRPLPLIEPAIVEYRWTFLAPEWVVERRNVDLRAVIPHSRTKRIDYSTLEFPIEHRAIARVPEFRCKYADFGLPNECRTTWRTVYADVPVAAIRRDHVDLDVPQWQWQDAHTNVDLPRLVWKEQQLVVSLPAVAVRTDPAR